MIRDLKLQGLKIDKRGITNLASDKKKNKTLKLFTPKPLQIYQNIYRHFLEIMEWESMEILFIQWVGRYLLE